MACDLQNDIEFSKTQKEAARARHLVMRRAEYKRNQAHCTVPLSHSQSKPNRIARKIMRTLLCRRSIEGAEDMPQISLGRLGKRKPNVAALLNFSPRVASTRHGLELDDFLEADCWCADQKMEEPVEDRRTAQSDTDTMEANNFDLHSMDCDQESNNAFGKEQKEATRSRHLIIRRAKYARRSLDSKRSVPVSHGQSKPNRIVRNITRTLLCHRSIQGPEDMPQISLGRHGKKKPNAAALLKFSPCVGSRTHSLEHDELEVDSWCASESCEQKEIEELWKGRHTANPKASTDTGPTITTVEESGTGESGCGDEDSSNKTPDDSTGRLHAECQGDQVVVHPVTLASEERDQVVADHTALEKALKREQVLRGIVKTLQAQQQSVEADAHGALAKCHDAEAKVQSMQQRQVAEKKFALQLEKQRAAKQRKQRQQAAHLQAVKERADLMMSEARRAKEASEAEVSARAAIENALQSNIDNKLKVLQALAAAEEVELLNMQYTPTKEADCWCADQCCCDQEVSKRIEHLCRGSPTCCSTDTGDMDTAMEEHSSAECGHSDADSPEKATDADSSNRAADGGDMLQPGFERDQVVIDQIAPTNDGSWRENDEKALRREKVLRDIVKTLQAQKESVEEHMQGALTKCHDAEAKVHSMQQQQVAEKKFAQQLEKQRAAKQRKQRQQAAHVQAVKERADRMMSEARLAREASEAEAAARAAIESELQSSIDNKLQVLQALAAEEAKQLKTQVAPMKRAKIQTRAARDKTRMRAQVLHAGARKAPTLKQQAVDELPVRTAEVAEADGDSAEDWELLNEVFSDSCEESSWDIVG